MQARTPPRPDHQEDALGREDRRRRGGEEEEEEEAEEEE